MFDANPIWNPCSKFAANALRVGCGRLPNGRRIGCYSRDVHQPAETFWRRPEPLPFWRVLLESRRFFLLATLAALALRLLFYFRFPHVTGDSLIYGDIAKNWLDRGIFGLTHSDGVHPTLIRLPGYPAFLAACFVLFGREHYHAVLLVQIAVDLVTCFFIADLARRTVSERAARFAFLLAALCPFTANYTVAPLAETLSIFFVAARAGCGRRRLAGVGRAARVVGRLDMVRSGRCGRNSVAARRRHSADRAGAVPGLADVAAS